MTEYVAWLDAMWAKWSPILMLTSYTVEWMHDEDDHAGYHAIQPRYPYLDYRITWTNSARELWQRDPRKAEAVIVHEFCHILTDPLYVKACKRYVTDTEIDDERERLTDHLQRVIVTLQAKIP